MDPPTSFQPAWSQSSSYPAQSQYVASQGHEYFDTYSAFDSDLQAQLQDDQSIAGLLDRASTIRLPDYYIAEDKSDANIVPTTPMGPPTQSRKRKAPTLRAEDWEPYRDRIVDLHITQDLPLKEVKQTMKDEFGFSAEIRQYRTRISQWGLDKNVKPKEMKAIVRKRQQRKLVEHSKAELAFTVRGNTVEPQNIDRWMKRHDVPESFVYSPSLAASTPSAVHCQTISERGSPFPSPMYSPAALILSPTGFNAVAQSPRVPSPALSIASLFESRSTFTGQSPAPTYQSLPTFLPDLLPVASAFQDQPNLAAASLPYRYKQTDEERLREELSRAEIVFGHSHSETLDVLYKLGIVLLEQGRYGSAEKMIRRLVEGRRRIGSHVDTLNASDLLGRIFHHQGLFGEAEKLHRRTLKSREFFLGSEHLDTLTSVRELGLVLLGQGKYDEAEAMHRRALEGCEKLLGSEHSNTLVSMGDLASIYWKQGRWKEAVELKVHVMQTRTRVLGKEHPHTLTSMANLAPIYWKQGRWKEAEELEVQVMQTRTRVLGKEHPHTLTIMANLASTYAKQGRWKEAEELAVQVMQTMTRVLGKEHPHTLTSMANLAHTWKSQGRNEVAISLMERCLELHKKVLGPHHPETEQSLNWLVNWQS
ncbi:hypothetical protein BDV96DRAFT_647324 [Lophiotrema nucula]|uniref:Clr5 domain-containing protein n=1 Tax=Lophiotrema nucula TaxID=690887 RepID=A0A6A5Z8C1_9PLEO|nr:hypothetical protein BDV96DRAFT_647324 [Lophiotrema nucula]